MQEESPPSQCPSDICTELVGLSSHELTHMIIIAPTTGNWLILTRKDLAKAKYTCQDIDICF